MKNLKKVLAVMTAVTAMAASTSAFAANIAEVTGDFAGEGNEYKGGKLTVVTPANADLAESDMTLLVLTEGADVDDPATADVDESAIDDGEILYIDQGTAQFKDCGLKTDVLLGDVTKADGHIIKVGYYDKVSGKFAIAQGYIKVSAEKPAGKQVKIVWGDVDCSASADINDALYIITAKAGGEKVVGSNNTEGFAIGSTVDSIVWGDVDCSTSADINDALYIITAKAGGEKVVGSNNTEGYAIGTEYTVTIEE